MNEIKNVFAQVIDLLEQDNRGVQLGCYTVALVGLSIAIRRVRPFSKFKKPSDIPNHFIKEKKELTGVVERIDPNGALLMIKHKPLVPLPGLSDGELPVKISGVKVSGLGLNWLQAIVAGNEVKFIPIAKAQNFVQCKVLLPQTRNNKVQIVNVGESLVRIGFGHVAAIDKTIFNDPSFQTYHKSLRAAQNYALKKRLGIKYYIYPTVSFLIAVVKSLNQVVVSSYRHIIHIPKMPAS